MAINIGLIAANRATQLGPNFTLINEAAAAPFDGLLTTVEIWAKTALEGCKVGTFYGTGNDLQCRDSALIGDVPSGSPQTIPDLTITVLSGDYIGMYFPVGAIEEDIFGENGLFYKAGDHFADGVQTYSHGAAYGISLGGLVEAAPPPAGGRSRAFVIG